LGGTLYLNSQLIGNVAGPSGSRLLQFQGVSTTQAAIQQLTDIGSPSFNENIASVQPVKAFKMFLAFSQPWWTKYNITSGVMVISAPAKKIYYWGVESTYGQPNNTNSVLLATYSDEIAATFWAQMLLGQTTDEPIYFADNPFYDSTHSTISLNGSDPRARMSRELMREIREAHQDPSIPDPFAAIFQDWSLGPFAWHNWNVGVDSLAVRTNLRKNYASIKTFVCGEAFSDYPGWVEGSLRSCEKLLIDQFNLASNWSAELQCV